MNDFLENDVDVFNEEYKELNLTEVTMQNKTFGHITILESSFLECTFDNVVFNHVVFSHVDLSNVNFTNCGLHHCQFIDCKMVGLSFVDSVLKSTTLQNIVGKYMGISYSKMEDCSILDSDLTEARIFDVKHTKFILENVNLKGTEFNMVSLSGVDLSTCNLENILMDAKYLRGAILGFNQMVELAPILGIKLK